MVYPEILQRFSDKVYPMHISLQNSLIKVAIYEICSMKWGPCSPNLRLGAWAPGLFLPDDAYGLRLLTQ